MADEKIRDTAVIGAGAAGLMAAIQARREGLNVLLLDGKEKIGAKILMSGGTRCNVTNEQVLPRDFQTEQPNILKAVLNSFSAGRALDFFKELGVNMVLEPGGKYFPSTHSGRTVLNALVSEIQKTGVHLQTSKRVEKIRFEKNRFIIEGNDFHYEAHTVILTTGGLSFPATGSDGKGYEIAKSFGHKMIPTSPSLTPLLTDDSDWKKLAGISLPVRLTLWMGGKKEASYEGSFLFTHSGFSGPVVLNISRHWIREKEDKKLTACFLPQSNEEKGRAEIMRETEENPRKLIKSFLADIFPERFVEILLEKTGISVKTVFNQFKKQEREALVRALFHFPLSVCGDQGYAKAEVTAGGLDLSELDKTTLESKHQSGLFFAGEILDVDGRIGGFNFQWAWASGFVAAKGVKRKLE